MKRMMTTVLASALGLAMVGCEAQSVSQVGEGPREALTYAATAHYPGNATTSNDVRASAVVNQGNNELTIYNVGDKVIPASALWVNGAFVRQIPSIAPRSSTKVKLDQLIEAGKGVQTFAQMNQPVNKVELQTSQGLYTVQGPARD